MNEVILIGPVGVGKTTTAKLLSKALNLPLVSMDDLRLSYYKEIGYNDEHMLELKKINGQKAVEQYWSIFDPHSIERILADHQNCVFDFGGGTTVCEYEYNFERMESALKPYPNVVLLIPSEDKKESLETIYERKNVKPDGFTMLEYFVYNDAHYRLAKHVVLVKDKSPEQVCDEVLALTQH